MAAGTAQKLLHQQRLASPGPPVSNHLKVVSGRLVKLIQEHSGSDTEHWKAPSQRCSRQAHKPDKSDCQWTRRFRALEPSKGVSALQS